MGLLNFWTTAEERVAVLSIPSHDHVLGRLGHWLVLVEVQALRRDPRIAEVVKGFLVLVERALSLLDALHEQRLLDLAPQRCHPAILACKQGPQI